MKLRKKLRKAAKLSSRIPLPLASLRKVSEPVDLVVQFAKAWSRNDAGAIAELFVEDADFVNVMGLWWRSKRAIKRAHEFGFEHAFEGAKLTIESVRERRVYDRVAVVHAQWRLTGQVDPDGHETGPRRGVMSFVATLLDDGSWIGIACHNTDTVTAADTLMSIDGHLEPASYISSPPADLLAAADREAQQQRDALALG